MKEVIINLYSEKEYVEKGVLPEASEEEQTAVNRYIEHDTIIDKYIKDKIQSFQFTEIEGRRKSLEWTKAVPDMIKPDKYVPGTVMDMIKECTNEFLGLLGTDTEKVLKNKNIVFIRVTEDFPVIREKDEDGEYVDVEVRSHVSEKAVYLFLEDFFYDKLLTLDSEQEQHDDLTLLELEISRRLYHEIGVIYGLPYEVLDTDQGVKMYNAMDVVRTKWFNAKAGNEVNMDALMEEYPELKMLQGEPVNLDKNLSGAITLWVMTRMMRMKLS